MPTHVKMNLAHLGGLIGTAMLGTILTTYSLCVHQGHCKKFLPMISDTWVYPPENYISRWVVGNVCILMMITQFAIYWIDFGGLTSKLDKGMCALGLFSTFCLAWVGAVCESKVPSCRGDNTVHSTFAVLFFIGYNIMMAVISCKKPAGVFQGALVAASLATKVRFSGYDLEQLPGLGHLDSSTLFAIVEWSDVGLVIAWTVSYLCRKGGDIHVAFINNNVPGDDPTPLSFWSMHVGAIFAAAMYIGTLAVTGVIYKSQGRWPAGGVPFISDMWVYPPNDWISRWSAVCASTIAIAVHCCAYYIEVDGNSQPPKDALQRTLLACVAMLGVSVVGCVDESENIVIHGIAAGTFFLGYDLFMVLTARRLLADGETHRGLSAAVSIAAFASVAAKLRFMPPARTWMEGFPVQYIPQIIEWTDAVAIGVFFIAYALAFGKARMSKVGVAIFHEAPEQGKEVLLPLA